MKIAYIAGAAIPSPKASTIQVMQMCQAMARLGHTVTLYSPSAAPEAELLAYYGVEPIFKVRRIGRGEGREGSALFQVRSALAARLDGAAVCYARGRGYLAATLAHGLGARVVYEAHGLPASPREARFVRRLARSGRVTLVAISKALRDKLAGPQFAVRSSQFVVAPDGVDLRRFIPPLGRDEARQLCGLPLDRKLVVYAGGLYAGRGVEELIEAIGGLEATLVVVGGGDERQTARLRALAHGQGTPAIFTGHRPPTEVPRYLFAADVLAMPYAASLRTATGEDTAAWMSPLKMFEYMAAGRPIVATDLPALREVLAHEANALLARAGDAASLQQQLGRLLAGGALASRLARQARQDVENYTWEKRAERILDGLGTIRG